MCWILVTDDMSDITYKFKLICTLSGRAGLIYLATSRVESYTDQKLLGGGIMWHVEIMKAKNSSLRILAWFSTDPTCG